MAPGSPASSTDASDIEAAASFDGKADKGFEDDTRALKVVQLQVRLLRAQLRAGALEDEAGSLNERLTARAAELKALQAKSELHLKARLLRQVIEQRRAAKKAHLAAQIEHAKRTQALLQQAIRDENTCHVRHQEQEAVAARLAALKAYSKVLEQPLQTGAPDWSGAASGWGPELAAQQVLPQFFPLKGKVDVKQHAVNVKLKIFDVPFARGANRCAQWALVDGKPHVLKRHLGLSGDEEIDALHEDFFSHEKACYLAEMFNKLASLCNDRSGLNIPSVSYHMPSVIVFNAPGAAPKKEVLLLEPFIPGDFTKWQLNDGTILQADEILEAFAHFSYRWSGRLGWESMVSDVQGVKAADGSFLLTDPVILTAAGGRTSISPNMGGSAIQTFLAEHTCGAACRALAAETKI